MAGYQTSAFGGKGTYTTRVPLTVPDILMKSPRTAGAEPSFHENKGGRSVFLGAFPERQLVQCHIQYNILALIVRAVCIDYRSTYAQQHSLSPVF
jgi:hypothetical protein